MNKRLTERERLHYKLDHLNETEIAEVLDYVNLIEAAKTPPAHAPNALSPESADDDVLSTLSGAYENRRARQVAEWENIRRRADSLASARHYAQP